MKRIATWAGSLCLVLTSLCAASQTNTTGNEYYKWKKKATEYQPGYVILRSGKKFEGDISLKGSPNSIKEISLRDGSSEKDFPTNALNEFGLYTSDPVCETEVDLIRWNKSEVNGVPIEKSKWKPGYIVTTKGVKHKGDLQIKKVNGFIEEFTVKSAATGDKEVFDRNWVDVYGLSLYVHDITKKNGKDFTDEARNFYSGKVEFHDGSSLEGVVAMHRIPGDGSGSGEYWGLYYAKNMDELVDFYKAEEVARAAQFLPTGALHYVPFQGHLVNYDALAEKLSKGSSNPSRSFQQGSVLLKSGEKVNGKLAISGVGDRTSAGMMPCTACGAEVNMTLANGDIVSYPASEIAQTVQEIEGEKVMYYVDHDMLVPMQYDGRLFRLFRNPYPTSESGIGNFAAELATATADELKEDAAVGAAKATIKQEGADLEQVVENAQAAHDAVEATGAALAAMLGSATRREWVIEEKANGRRSIFTSSKYDDEIEGMLMGCEKYFEMDKKQIKELKQFDNIKQAVQFIDDCY